MTRSIERSFFTTGNIADSRQKVHAWRDSVKFIFDVNPVHAPDRRPFHTYVESYNFGSMVTSLCDSVASHWDRSPLDAARNGVDHFLVQVYLSGSCQFTGDAGDAHCAPGDILLLDASRTTRSRTTDFRNLTLWLPRGLLERSLSDPDSLHGRVMKGQDPITSILRSYLVSMHEKAGSLTPAQGTILMQPTLDLLVASLDASPDIREERRSTINAATLVEVKRFIREHLASPALTTDAIAGAVNVSRATLYRICEPLGGIQNYVRQQRLRKVLKSLLDPSLGHLPIARIAAYWGFEETSSFNRVFRREFGLTPREARNHPASVGRSRLQAHAAAQQVGDRDYETWVTRLVA